MDIGMLDGYNQELVIENSNMKTDDPEYIKKTWMMINKKLNKGMRAEKYWIVQNHALNLLHGAFKVILRNDYDSLSQNDHINRLVTLGYVFESQEKIDFLKVENFTNSNFEILTFSLKSIGTVLYRLWKLDKVDIEPNSDKLRAEVGELIEGKCTITKFIGASDDGRVLEAIYEGMDKKVALKEISRHAYPFFNYENEKKILMSLKHKGISKIYDVLRDNQTYYIVMDFIEGDTLTAYIEKHGKLQLQDVKQLAKELIEIIIYLNHNKFGKICSNLNPDNIMIDGQNHLHLIDFGGDYDKKSRHENIGMFTGGASYLSPEHIEGKDTDIRSDIFSVGGIIYYMAEGRKPIPGNRQTYRSTTDYNLVGIIEKAMAKNLKLRYQNANKFLYDLDLLNDLPEKTEPFEYLVENHQNERIDRSDFSDDLRQNNTRNTAENSSKQIELMSQMENSISPQINFVIQILIGIIVIIIIIVFVYLISKK